MHIIFITPEALPFSRAGGLGDVSFYLPAALAHRGHDVTVLLPKHRGSGNISLIELQSWQVEIDLSLTRRKATYWQGETGGEHKAVLVGCDDLFDRSGLYGNEFGDYDDNGERFIFFARAAFKALAKIIEADTETIIHCHDWASGLVPMYIKHGLESYPFLAKVGTVFTYHNLASQGVFSNYDFAMTGLDWKMFNHDCLEFYGQMNLMKAGLLGADIITTVSHKYAQESFMPEFGMGLEGVLRSREKDIVAVPHGVDYDKWSPEADPFISSNYSQGDMAGKKECRLNLATIYGFDDVEKPIVSMVCRLLSRKGLDLFAKALPQMMEMPINVAVMGLGEIHYQEFLREFALKWPGRMAYKQANDAVLGHHILSGSDIFVMPSRFEPCGLEQLYAMRYGSVPVVRATGGLDDTVIDVTAFPNEGTGYKFSEYCPNSFLEVLRKAVNNFHDKRIWGGIIKRAMAENFSWDIAAAAYEEIYKKALKKESRPGLAADYC